ncbi:GNAT family N-acetyltransferase [Phyllobacterium endophyticum]|uniref:GNAT family N-acetyltransferase n=1 Tax=Phyllobacterium endophyticum TaxID=1149773 RepID=UPI0011CAD0E3|nr:GNAT family N-acetyltransferase [Phyllobacterium endophyticum]
MARLWTFASLSGVVRGGGWSLCGTLYFSRRFLHVDPKPRRGAYIQDLVVTPQFRGYGIGQQLLHHAIKQLADKGGQYIRLSVDAQNRSAQALFVI